MAATDTRVLNEAEDAAGGYLMPFTLEEEHRARLHRVIDGLPSEVLAAVEPVLETVERADDMKAVFLQRALRAITTIADGVPLISVAAAASDYDVLLELLALPEVEQVLPPSDPLAKARLRGLVMKRQLLKEEGGTISSKEVGQILGITRQAVDKRRHARQLIALQAGRNYVYPLWQFDTNRGGVLPGLEAVIQTLGVQEPWMQTAWLLADNGCLEGQSPLAALQAGDLEAVLAAARSYGEQGAV